MPASLHKPLISLVTALAVLIALPSIAAGSQPTNYWLVSSTGQVFAYGKAKTHGSEAGKHYSGKITGIKGTANGGGYWIVTTKKHYGFGDTGRYKYRAGGLKKYAGKVHPKNLRGKIVGYAVATIPAPTKSGGGGTKTTTTPTKTTTTTIPSPPTVNCSSATIQTSSLNKPTATDPFSETLKATGVNGGTWTWTLKSGSLPAGLNLSSGGVLSGTPTVSTGGTQSTFTVQATNSKCTNIPASRSYTLAVAVPPMSITTQALDGGQYGVPYTQTLTVTGGQPGNYEWSATGLPSGLSLSTSGVLTGNPTTTGTFNGVQITVTDPTGGTAAVSSYFSITVTLPPLQITTSSLNSGQDTISFSGQTLTATGGTAMEFPPGDRAAMYVWSAAGLPTGLTLSTSGVLSGTPTESGTYNPQITVADAADNVPPVTQTYSLSIALAPLTFTTTTLTAIQGQSCSEQIIANGGQSPYSVSLLSGSLPTGVQFNDGTIYGTPTASSGDYQFSIGVSDSQSTPATASETFNMEIAPSQTSPDLNVSSSPSTTIWAGYLEQASSPFTSVSGTFTVPTVRGTPTNSVTPWVGIDGYGVADLIQAGVAAIGGNSTTSYEAWWDTVPSPVQDQFSAAAGDTISVNIWQISNGQWEITLNDLTSGQGFATQVSYTGSGDTTAEWIVETPDDSSATGYPATSTFSNLEASQAGSGMLALSSPGATPGTLSGSGFSISDNN
jgi:hypothetical protein